MKILRAIALIGLALTVAACSRTGTMGTMQTASAPMPQPSVLTNPMPTMTTPEPQAPALQQARLDPGSYNYIDGAALNQLSPAQRSAANDAQFYALQFGRPGAPRTWNSAGANGSVSVGPYVRVNSLDCREFTHRVTISGETYTSSGQACREVDGAWTVSA